MATKAEKTTEFIIQQVAPIFNKNGYVGTSLADILQATGLSKGAIYGNFESKEHLAIESFNYILRKVIGSVANRINAEESGAAKLQALTNYYRSYYQLTLDFGGCPILNVGIDSNNMNPALKVRVNAVIEKLITNIETILEFGIEQGEFKREIHCSVYAKRIYSIIEGCLFTTIMTQDESHLLDMMDFLDAMIQRDILK